ncbi:MAG: CRISPR-associated endonuclease Cas2 [Deltaproteobacteria bacterium]|nr:MAG: CRISPR-associated endonuclease Cas2 [Deltaproteobacteria bacterium]RLB03016.1 MAG: CRISPR-associated endonuclease Cas2 [Deltaproteobacteria bacterium]HEC32104.1 CRISPR-associated endonuclease Cas2 [Deltaproteobacteria bacterium]
MYVMVSYDVVEDKKRNRLFKYLKDFGVPVQKSVFECDLSPEQLDRMVKGVERIIDLKSDKVRYYPLCKQCVGRVVISGWGEIQEN